MSESMFDELGQNAGLAEELFKVYQSDRSLVPESWLKYFDQFKEISYQQTALDTPKQIAIGISSYDSGVLAGKELNGVTNQNGNSQKTFASSSQHAIPSQVSELHLAVFNYIQAYRSRGHLLAQISPLKKVSTGLPIADDLDLANYPFTDRDFEETVPSLGFMGFEQMRLADLVRELSRVYCASIGAELEHIHSQEERLWLQERFEKRFSDSRFSSREAKRQILDRLIGSEIFESQLHKKYVGHKRFSLQGSETLMVLLDTIAEHCSTLGVKEVVFGMPHRGRLTVLTQILKMPLIEILSQFEDQSPATMLGSGDVKYHLGHTGVYIDRNNQRVRMSLTPNPSHLEAVNPVVEGVVRARQDLHYYRNRAACLPVLIHGDAAVVGQGVVPETFNLAGISAYSTGGTVHIVVNNQIGFTTNSEDDRSTPYCTEWAKAIQAPIFHVNSEDPEACAWVAALALEYRQTFGRDVMIDLYGYRKYGHNEADDPSYTQPVMYDEISDKSSLSMIYSEELLSQGVIEQHEIDQIAQRYSDGFELEFNRRSAAVPGEACSTIGRLGDPIEDIHSRNTGVDLAELTEITSALVSVPEGFTVHPKLEKLINKRTELLNTPLGIDWAFAEALAFGSLLKQGLSIRLTGQDSRRGTFSHRHMALFDYNTSEPFLPLSQIAKISLPPVSFEVYNSTLSEYACMGFEFGYASQAQNSLVLWEAQFGDFANGAQIIIDQFLSSSEAKWHQFSGLTLLLPHGYEGQGPEHSSARLERYLQLCADGNMCVCYPTTAAQYFHLLRRQGLLKVKRPLIIMSPKSLLRSSDAASSSAELTSGGFSELIEDAEVKSKEPKHLIFVSGKFGFNVRAALSDAKVKSAKLFRVEQLYPFNSTEIKKVLKKYKKADSFIWVQEEPRNMGAYQFISDKMRSELGVELSYIGRASSASTATGSPKRHANEQAEILSKLLELIS